MAYQFQRSIVQGGLDQILSFLEDGIDVNALFGSGESPLAVALINNRLDVARLLVSKGAEIQLTELQDEANAMFLLRKALWSAQLTEFILNTARINVPLTWGNRQLIIAACVSDSPDELDIGAARLLLDVGGNELTDDFYGTPLHLAARNGYVNMCRTLLALAKERGENLVGVLNFSGETPLMSVVHVDDYEYKAEPMFILHYNVNVVRCLFTTVNLKQGK